MEGYFNFQQEMCMEDLFTVWEATEQTVAIIGIAAARWEYSVDYLDILIFIGWHLLVHWSIEWQCGICCQVVLCRARQLEVNGVFLSLSVKTSVMVQIPMGTATVTAVTSVNLWWRLHQNFFLNLSSGQRGGWITLDNIETLKLLSLMIALRQWLLVIGNIYLNDYM